MGTELRFDGRVALVTGAGSGLGYEYSRSLARLGAAVVLCDVRAKHGETAEEATAGEAAEQLRAEGFDAIGVCGDVGDEEFASSLVPLALERRGRLDVLINNAGMRSEHACQDLTTEELDRVFRVNLCGAAWLQRDALRVMRSQGYGRIVNTSSGTAMFGMPNMAAYVISKSAVVGLTKAATAENRDVDITVNALCPIALTVMSRPYFGPELGADRLALLDPSRIAPVVLYMAHSQCVFTGEVISAHGGRWSRLVIAQTSGVQVGAQMPDRFDLIEQMMDPSALSLLELGQPQFRVD